MKKRDKTQRLYLYIIIIFAAYILFISQLNLSTGRLTLEAVAGNTVSTTGGLTSLSSGASEADIVASIIPQDSDINRPYSWKGSPVTLTVQTSGNGYDVLVDMERSIALTDLTADQVSRYNNLIKNIYHPCCGAPIASCGCKHAVAAKGVIKKLLQEGWSDDQIQQEVFLWYRFFWPKHYATMGTYLFSQGADLSEISAEDWLGERISTVQAGKFAASELGLV